MATLNDSLALLLTSADTEMVTIGKSLVIDPASPSGLVWKETLKYSNKKPGDMAGYRDKKGYWCVGVNGKYHQAHRVVWLLAHGAWPADGMQIDHVNQVKSDNRIENLRVVTNAQNQQNISRAQSSNYSSIYRGVSWHKRLGKWAARIMIEGKSNALGCFDSEYEAHLAYESARIMYHPYSPVSTAAPVHPSPQQSLRGAA